MVEVYRADGKGFGLFRHGFRDAESLSEAKRQSVDTFGSSV